MPEWIIGQVSALEIATNLAWLIYSDIQTNGSNHGDGESILQSLRVKLLIAKWNFYRNNLRKWKNTHKYWWLCNYVCPLHWETGIFLKIDIKVN